MKPESGINNRWKLLESIVGVENLKSKFNAYGWYYNIHLKISKDEHWGGWWNDCFNFVDVFPKTDLGKELIQSITDVFTENGYTIQPIVNNGISIIYMTMTQQESHEKAKQNLLNGGRMSD